MVADGAMGTMLFQRGLKSGECPEKINLKRPEILEEIVHAYIEAGAEIIQTNTFGGSPLKLKSYGLDDKAEEINSIAVKAAQNAAKGKAFIGLSVGPCGKLLKPYGDTEPEDVFNSFKRQIGAIASFGIDIICIETMTDLHEALLALKACKEVAPSIPVSVSMTYDATPRGFFTIMGVTIQQATDALSKAGADILGSNCGNGSQNMILIAAEMKKYTNLPILIRSNAGLPKLAGDTIIYPENPEYMADKAQELLKLGVRIIGGCCGTTPAHISAIAKVINIFDVTQGSPIIE